MVDQAKSGRLGNLNDSGINVKASQARLDRGRLGDRPASLAFQGMMPQGGTFDAMMAVNQSQNQVFGEVLKGPVSQQTQRQLAQLQAMNMKSMPDNLVTDLAVQEETPVESVRSFGNLKGGRTIAPGVDTGRIFTSAQLESYRQRNGFFRLVPETELKKVAEVEENKSAEAVKNMLVAESEAEVIPEIEVPEEDGILSSESINGIINKVGQALGLDPALIKAVVKTESNFNHRAVSKAGARGLMQLMPKTAKEMGVEDPFNPLENIWGGARYLKRMLDSNGGNLDRALAAYNWGPGNLERHGSGSYMPQETRRYIEVVNRNYSRFKKETASA